MSRRRMLSIQAILNHPQHPQSPKSPSSQPSASELSSPGSDLTDALPSGVEQKAVPKARRIRDSKDLSYTRPQGPIKHAPYEAVDEAALNLMRPFNIHPFGEISRYCAHIPYSSDKKDVFRKTGRENFNVFVYRFTDPNDHQTYDVMWDSLGGFVRISPFFKSRKHKKTGPAKMLDANHGLRDITFHMTGGNRIAQGYWIPYSCARAVCATFCYPIAGALIPIFGPDFPRDCIKPDCPRFGCMEIDERIIQKAKLEVKAYRHSSPNNPPKPQVTTSGPAPLQDAYSISMKERLENHSAPGPPKFCPSEQYNHVPARNSHRYARMHAGWPASPARETTGVPATINIGWTPTNAGYNAPRPQTRSNLQHTSIPNTLAAEQRHAPVPAGGAPIRQPLKRRQTPREEARKRQKLSPEQQKASLWKEPHPQIHNDFHTMAQLRTHREAVARQTVTPHQVKAWATIPFAEHVEEKKTPRAGNDFEAAFILMDMPRFAIQTSPATGIVEGAHCRTRARSI